MSSEYLAKQIQVVGGNTSEIVNWQEFHDACLVTAGSKTLLYLKRAEEGTSLKLVQVKIGIKSSDAKEKDILAGFSILRSDVNFFRLDSIPKWGYLSHQNG